MILIDQVMPASVDSTATFIVSLSRGYETPLSYPVEQLALRCFIDQLACPLCLAPPRYMCHTFGGQNLRRTHLVRLQSFTDVERKLAIRWALLEHDRQQRER